MKYLTIPHAKSAYSLMSTFFFITVFIQLPSFRLLVIETYQKTLAICCYRKHRSMVLRINWIKNYKFFQPFEKHICLDILKVLLKNQSWNLCDYPYSKKGKFSKQLTFLNPWYVHLCMLIREQKMLTFQEKFRTYYQVGNSS